MSSGTGPVILYDGVCGLCDASVQFILKFDKNKVFRFAPLQGQTANRVLQRHGQTLDALDTMYVVLNHDEPDERLLLRSEAALFIGRQLGGMWRTLAAGFSFYPAILREGIYNLIARYRYKLFGRYETCPLPDPAVRDRFLD